MLKKIMFITLLFLLLFSGCTVTNTEPTLSLQESVTITPKVFPATITPKLEETIVQQTVNPIMTSTPTILATQTTHPNLSLVCTTLPKTFNFRDTLGISFITSLRFVDENILTFEGWAPGKQTSSQDTSTNQDLSQGSFDVTFKAGIIDLVTGNITSRQLVFERLLANPCQEDCISEILGQSPDGSWQIIQVVSSGEFADIGVWLVGLNDMTQLVSYVPSSSKWQWADDSLLLWYVYPDRDFGAFANTIHLESPLTSQFYDNSDESPTNATNNLLAFNPSQKIVASIQESGSLESRNLFIIDVDQRPFETVTSQVMPGTVSVEWNEATQSYLFNLIQEDGIEFKYEGGSTFLTNDLLNTLYTSLAEGKVSLEAIAPKSNFAVSQSGKFLAIAYKHGEIDVFACQ